MMIADTKVDSHADTCARTFLQGNLRLAPCILKAEKLTKSFGGQHVLKGVDIELHRGEVVLLRGENGSGKTTLLNILTGSIEPDTGVIQYLADDSPRTYRFPRRWWQELNPFDHFTPEFVAQEGLGRTWQDVRLFGSQSLRDNISIAVPGHPGEKPLTALLRPGLSAQVEGRIIAEADAMLARLGLSSREGASADKISLGQSKRVAIARAVAAGAKILFLDEPLAGLDHCGITDVLALLKSLVHNENLTLVIVEHVFNQMHLRDLVTTDWLLARGTLTVTKSESAVSDSAAAPAGRPAWLSLLACDEDEIVDEPLPHGALLTRIRRAGVVPSPLKPVLEIRDLVIKRGPRTVIGLAEQGQPGGFNLTLYQGEIAILQAPNGWGKSTLFAAAAGLINAEAGEIRLDGLSLVGLPTWERVKRGLRALPSDQHTFLSLKAKESLALAGRAGAQAELGPLADRTCSSLSGGQRQRVALAALPLGGRQRMTALLDEPFSMLDSAAIAEVAAKLRGLPGDTTTLILSPSSFANQSLKGDSA